MVPVLELRFGLPYAFAKGLNMWVSICISIIGNLLPVPFVIIYMRRLFNYIRKHFPKFDGLITKLETRTEKKSEKVLKYAFFGMFLLVAIPLPGTGAWTGAMVAAIIDMRLKKAFPAIAFGVIAAAIFVSLATWGVFKFLIN
ncbi:MAG: small multi-drug export protein [Clostridia bacterium]|nr:small multi-drug export protein [Clostridia bacterium]